MARPHQGIGQRIPGKQPASSPNPCSEDFTTTTGEPHDCCVCYRTSLVASTGHGQLQNTRLHPGWMRGAKSHPPTHPISALRFTWPRTGVMLVAS
jgi:hypothetical protein